jgi:hypothetical protein
VLKEGMKWTERQGLSWPEDRQASRCRRGQGLQIRQLALAVCHWLPGWQVAHALGLSLPHPLLFDAQHRLPQVCEEGGCFAGADPARVSDRAKKRGLSQLGSLGSGNHYTEVQVSGSGGGGGTAWWYCLMVLPDGTAAGRCGCLWQEVSCPPHRCGYPH